MNKTETVLTSFLVTNLLMKLIRTSAAEMSAAAVKGKRIEKT